MKYCALCCIAKDEDVYLKEWISYHLLLGFEHIFLYDDMSRVPVAELLQGWASPQHVTILRRDTPLKQQEAYDHCLENFGKHFSWIAFLDVDEFLRLGSAAGDPCAQQEEPQAALPGTEAGDIRCFLSEFEPYAALGVNWRMFGWNGHEKRPLGLVLASYTQCLGDDVHIKSVVQPVKIGKYATPHSFHVRQGAGIVNAAHFPIASGFPFCMPETRRIAVHHYYYKSRACFMKKVSRGYRDGTVRSMSQFETHIAKPVSRDASLLPLVPAVRKGIKNFPLPPVPYGPQSEEAGPVRPSVSEEVVAINAGLLQGAPSAVYEALLRLNTVAMLNNAEAQPSPLLFVTVWMLRAKAALLNGKLELAAWCLKQALTTTPSTEVYALLAELHLRLKDVKASAFALELARLSASTALLAQEQAAPAGLDAPQC